MNAKHLAHYIDHTALTAEKTETDILTLCDEAIEYQFFSVCINSCHIPLAKQKLAGTPIKICTVVGFPLGANLTSVKVFETQAAIAAGADEIDMVMNIGQLKDGHDQYVIDEIKAVKEACGDRLLKVIIETCLLTDEEKKRATQDVILGGADFVKTSTGFSTHGATVEDVKILKAVAGDAIQVKAAGGVRSKDDLYAMIEAGAQRIGTSSGVKLMEE